jgi:hypothetical protein
VGGRGDSMDEKARYGSTSCEQQPHKMTLLTFGRACDKLDPMVHEIG